MSFLNQIFGSRPNYSGVKSPYSQATIADPGLSDLTGKESANIGTYLSGQLPGDVQRQIKNFGALWGVNSGMPGSGAADDVTLEKLGLSSLGEMQTGSADYMNFLTGFGGQMLNPTIQMQQANAAAAPNPVASGILDMYATAAGLAVGSRAGMGGGYGLRSSGGYSDNYNFSPGFGGGGYSYNDTSSASPSFDTGLPFNFDTSALSYDLGGVGPSGGTGGVSDGVDNTFDASLFT